MDLGRRFVQVARLGRSAGRILRRHAFSIVSAAMLAVFAVLVLTSDSFESRGPERAAAGEGTAASSTAAARPRRTRVLFYVVNDVAQRDQLAEAVQADSFAFVEGGPPADYIFYLIAGTKQEEAETIDRLNFEEMLARQSRVDMRVIDVRGRFD